MSEKVRIFAKVIKVETLTNKKLNTMEENVNKNTLFVLSYIAIDLKFKTIVVDKNNIINLVDKFIDYGKGNVVDYNDLNEEEVYNACLSIYQRIPSERLIRGLHIELWKQITDRGIEHITHSFSNIDHNVVVVLTTLRGNFNLIPDTLTIYDNVDDLMNGKKVIDMSLDCDYWSGGMKGVIVMLYGFNKYVASTDIASWFDDIYNIANNFNPNL